MQRRGSASPIEDSRTPSLSLVTGPALRGSNGRDIDPSFYSSFLQSDQEEASGRKTSDSSDLSPEESANLRNPSTPRSPIISTKETTMSPLESQLSNASMDGSIGSRRRWRSRARSPWSNSLLTLAVTLLGLLTVFGIVYSYLTRQIDPQGCKTPRMVPTYIKLLGFDSEHTRFASKYGLYLYRERNVDAYSEEDIGLKGVPVLFLPGNAGSYRQGRSLAAEASNYFHDALRHDQDRYKAGTRSLDFFMADFNEDMAAFHGQTLLDQAEYVNEALSYILSLYHDPRRPGRDPNLPDPTSVILIGHSMGGIVARTVLTMSNYQANSVNTIITMSTPHARPPVSFDSDLVHTYKQINDYWREAYSQKWANHNPLWHVTLISIAGGGGDSIVPSDYTSLSSLVPDTHGFTVFTTTMPTVWTGMDHLSIAWCDSFRKVIIRSLFDIVDVQRSSQTKQRADRMNVFKKWYLTGLEDGAEKVLTRKNPNTLLTLGDNVNAILPQGQRLVLREFGKRRQPEAHLLTVPSQGVPGKKFTLLSDQILSAPGGSGKLEVLFCSVFPLRAGLSSAHLSHSLDLSDGSSGATRLACKSAVEDLIQLPASTRTSKYPFDAPQPFSYLQYDLEDLAEHQFVAVVDKAERLSTGWVVAEFSNSSDAVIPTRVGLGRLVSTGLNIRLPADRPMLTEVKIPAMHSSLLAYKLRVGKQPCGEDAELFTPFVRQYIEEPYESKYFVNVKEAEINLHGIAPYMPPHLRETSGPRGVSFQLWSDPSCNASVELSLSVDVLGSLGKLVMRYRTVFAAFPLVVVALVIRKQFKIYDQTGVFIPFSESLDLCLRSSLPVLFLGLSFLASSLASSSPVIAAHGPSNWRTNATESVIDFTKNDLLLGSQDTFYWFLVPVFGVISVAVCVLINHVAMFLTSILSVVRGILVSRRGYIKIEDQKAGVLFSPLSPNYRIVNTAVLLLLVSTVIPYQFAYIVACIVQLATCVKASAHAKETRTSSHYNFYNYVHSIFILMLWILPVNVLVLIVWVHNLAVHWLTPFSSHHNVLSIMPFLLLVETLASQTMVPRVTSRFRHITSIIFFVLAVYAAIYGVTYAYLLHHIVNLGVAWLVGVHLSTSGFSLRGLKQLLEGGDFRDEGSATVHGHLKKLP
ncbi:hypothetical protein AJ80_05573 [Polytolypa hystricis UAMH7299]|uniref:GPI inositol-deacylase n=1 Tax=Polytolypa hystricis (strain UAMH7299) TaxID=1447883 RepID=A0A2B7Y2N6_POLH7|nr:hypothetical protein AJ80_05573 [Polytolypa hystricis UAMH7299]